MPAPPGFLPPQPPVDPAIIEQVRQSLLPPGRYGLTAIGWLFEPDGGRVRIRSGIHDAEGWHDKALDYIDTHLTDEGVGLRWLARHVEVKAGSRPRACWPSSRRDTPSLYWIDRFAVGTM